MCGIAGYFGKKERTPDQIQECLKRMYRRGPDYSQSYHHVSSGRHVHLLHSRLSIIDLDPRSNQPFRIGSSVMVFNGEIYNYKELKQSLLKESASFSTESDTEVLLRLMMEKGWKALDECEGMWAFAVYNEKDGSLILSRDRFGEKPLYLFFENGDLYFGSEIKFITALLGHSLEVNEGQLFRYLVNGYKALYKKPETFFAGLRELPSSTVLELNAEGKPRESHYWKPSFGQDSKLTYEDAVAQTRAALIESVRLRLRADVPLAFCMSGGIDSNALISIAKKELKYDVHGFTISNTDPRYDERELVQNSVQELGIRHTFIPVKTDNFLENLRKLVMQHDAPVYTITYYAHWLLMESVAEHGYKISISGTAADELFTGYYDHHLAYLYEIQNQQPLYELSVRAWEENIKPLVQNPFLSNPRLFIENPKFRDHIFLDSKEFASYLKAKWFEEFSEEKFCESLLRNRMLNEMFHEAVPPLLHEDDLNAMYFSVENRTPFLDRKLFETAYRIPSKHLIQQGAAKAVLRAAMRGIVPDRILDTKRKVGFNASILSFLDHQNEKVKSSLLDQSPIFDYVRREPIEQLLKKGNMPNSESKFLFYFISAKMFLEEFKK